MLRVQSVVVVVLERVGVIGVFSECTAYTVDIDGFSLLPLYLSSGYIFSSSCLVF